MPSRGQFHRRGRYALIRANVGLCVGSDHVCLDRSTGDDICSRESSFGRRGQRRVRKASVSAWHSGRANVRILGSDFSLSPHRLVGKVMGVPVQAKCRESVATPVPKRWPAEMPMGDRGPQRMVRRGRTKPVSHQVLLGLCLRRNHRGIRNSCQMAKSANSHRGMCDRAISAPLLGGLASYLIQIRPWLRRM